MSKGSILLIILCSGFLFVVDPFFNHFEPKQEKETKGSETPVWSRDCLDPSYLHVNPAESSLSHVFVWDFFPRKSTEINSIYLVGIIFLMRFHSFWLLPFWLLQERA